MQEDINKDKKISRTSLVCSIICYIAIAILCYVTIEMIISITKDDGLGKAFGYLVWIVFLVFGAIFFIIMLIVWLINLRYIKFQNMKLFSYSFLGYFVLLIAYVVLLYTL